MNCKLLTTVAISLLCIIPALSRPAVELNYRAHVLVVVSPNVLIVNNLYDHAVETIILAQTVVSNKEQVNYAGKLFVENECLGRDITVISYGKDRYGRVVAEIKTDRGWFMSYELIAAGYVYWYAPFNPNDDLAKKMEQWAKRHHSGVWHV